MLAQFLLQIPSLGMSLVGIIIAVVAVFFVIIIIWANRYTKVPPNTVMVISGGFGQTIIRSDGTRRKLGFRIIKGGGTFVWPVIERVDMLSLELMTIDVKTPEVYTLEGVPVIVDGVAQIKIKSDDVSIATAVEQFLSKGNIEIANIAQQTLEGHLRAILGTLTVEEIYKNRDVFAQNVQEVAATDLANMGLNIISFTIRDVRDTEGYLDALGKKRTAEVKRDATIGEAEAQRDATIKSAHYRQEGETAKYEAETKIAESNRDYEMQVADYTKDVNTQKAQADLAYDLQKNTTLRQVREQEVEVEIVEKHKRIELQQLEIMRKEKELDATVQRPADAKKYEVQRLAEAERFRLENIAEGQASSKKLTGFAAAEVVQAEGSAEGEAIKAKGLAEAEVVRQKGLSEAAGSLEKAHAWQEYNEAAIAQLLIERLPEIARAISEPMSRIERIVIVGGNSGTGTGASKITQDIGQVLAELPPVVKALSGLDLQELIDKLPKIAAGLNKSKDGKLHGSRKGSGGGEPARRQAASGPTPQGSEADSGSSA
ncbi:flotillin family protein [bacterium]|nr:flotillin family protein [bacterium]